MRLFIRYVPNLRFSYTDNWTLIRLFDLGEVSRGKSKHRPRDDVKLYNGPYPFIQTGDIRNSNLYIKSYNKTYSEFGLLQSKLWDEGTLCITIAANIAESAILSFKSCFPDSIIGFNSNDKTNNFFIKYYLDHIKQQLEILSVGCAQNNLNLEKLSKLKIYIPSLEEQYKIILLLNKINERIDTQSKIIEEYKLQKKVIQNHIFNSVKNNHLCFLPEICTIKTGKLDANAMKEKGKYKFFTCAKDDYYTDTYSFNGPSLLISGNGDVGLIKYYNGKFNAYQRTYVLQNFKINPIYIKCIIEKVLPYKINKEKNIGAMTYIVLSTLNNLQIPITNSKSIDIISKLYYVLDEKITLEEKILKGYFNEKIYLLKNLFI